MKLEIGQVWKSEPNPHENFVIYDGIVDTCVDAFKDESIPFNEQPESVKIFFWKRIDEKAFEEFVKTKKGEDYKDTYPYPWNGESKKAHLIAKIRKNDMKLNTGQA